MKLISRLLDLQAVCISILLEGIERLTKNDYSVKLGSLLEAQQRKYYAAKNFTILKIHLRDNNAGNS